MSKRSAKRFAVSIRREPTATTRPDSVQARSAAKLSAIQPVPISPQRSGSLIGSSFPVQAVDTLRKLIAGAPRECKAASRAGTPASRRLRAKPVHSIVFPSWPLRIAGDGGGGCVRRCSARCLCQSTAGLEREPDSSDAFAVDVPGFGIRRVAIERLTEVGHLEASVRALDLAELGEIDARAGLHRRRLADDQRRPDRRTCARTFDRALLLCVVVEREPARVDDDLA